MKTEWSNKDSLEIPEITAGYGSVSWSNYKMGTSCDSVVLPIIEAIPIEWIKEQKVDFQNKDYPFNYCRGIQDGFNDCIDYLLSKWEEEDEIN